MKAKRLTVALIGCCFLAAVGTGPVAVVLGDPPAPSKPEKKGDARPKGDDKKDDKPKDDPKKDEAAAKVEVNVMIVRATTKNKDIDGGLKALAEKLKKDYKYTGFKIEKQATPKADLNQDVTLDYKDYRVVVTPVKREGEKVELKIVVTRQGGKDKKEERVAAATLTSKAGELAVVGGPNDGDDKLIILAGAK